METLLLWDERLFYYINSVWHHPFLDALLPIWRNKLFWLPLYIFLISFVAINAKKNILAFFVAIIVLMTISDTISSKILKKTFERPRPCRTEHIEPEMRKLLGCSKSYSFPSSHAFNHFAIAVFLILTLGKSFKQSRYWLLLWAASIAYAQVYVGVHFPLDVLLGALMGTLVAYIVANAFNHKTEIKF